jgi:hypothetical protein
MDVADMIYDLTELASRRRFVSGEDRIRVEELIAEVGRLPHGLVRSLDTDF